MSDPFIGEIKLVGFNFAPRGWAFCAGQLLPIAQNTALFSLLGTVYGGDGRVTFALPDLRGRAAIHFGAGPGLPDYRLGAKAGQPSTTLSALNLPSHSHVLSTTVNTQANISIPANSNEGDSSVPGDDKILAKSSKGLSSTNIYTSSTENTTLKPVATPLSIPIQGQTLTTGGSQSFSNQSPVLAMNYVIALVGIFPSRS